MVTNLGELVVAEVDDGDRRCALGELVALERGVKALVEVVVSREDVSHQDRVCRSD